MEKTLIFCTLSIAFAAVYVAIKYPGNAKWNDPTLQAIYEGVLTGCMAVASCDLARLLVVTPWSLTLRHHPLLHRHDIILLWILAIVTSISCIYWIIWQLVFMFCDGIVLFDAQSAGGIFLVSVNTIYNAIEAIYVILLSGWLAKASLYSYPAISRVTFGLNSFTCLALSFKLIIQESIDMFLMACGSRDDCCVIWPNGTKYTCTQHNLTDWKADWAHVHEQYPHFIVYAFTFEAFSLLTILLAWTQQALLSHDAPSQRSTPDDGYSVTESEEGTSRQDEGEDDGSMESPEENHCEIIRSQPTEDEEEGLLQNYQPARMTVIELLSHDARLTFNWLRKYWFPAIIFLVSFVLSLSVTAMFLYWLWLCGLQRVHDVNEPIRMLQDTSGNPHPVYALYSALGTISSVFVMILTEVATWKRQRSVLEPYAAISQRDCFDLKLLLFAYMPVIMELSLRFTGSLANVNDDTFHALLDASNSLGIVLQLLSQYRLFECFMRTSHSRANSPDKQVWLAALLALVPVEALYWLLDLFERTNPLSFSLTSWNYFDTALWSLVSVMYYPPMVFIRIHSFGIVLALLLRYEHVETSSDLAIHIE